MSDDNGQPRGQDELQAELNRLRAENERLRGELAARVGAATGGPDKSGVLEGTLFISEVEVRSAVARQLRNGARLLQATKCVYLLFDGTSELVAQRPALGVGEEALTRFRTPVSRGISGEVFKTRKAARIDQLEGHERASEERLGEVGCRNGICVPLLIQIRDEENRVIDSKAIGVLWVMNRRGAGGFSDDDERLLTVFARQVAAVVSNAKFFQELVQQNQTLVSTFENIPAGILLVGKDERIQLVNATARQLFGIAQSRGVGEHYYRLIDHQPTCDVLGATLLEDEDKIAEIEFEFGEEERIFQIQAARVKGGDDSLDGVVAIFDDVTEVHRLDRMKQEFVQTFSTELLGPLSSIQGFAGVLERVPPEEFGPDFRGELHQVIGEECARLRRHIQDLLNVSRFEQGIRLTLNRSKVDLGSMVRRVAELEAQRNRGHQLELEVPAELPLIVADAPRLEEVVYNLINNAFKYSPDGGVVRVVVEPVAHGVKVSVTDHGVGIAPESHEQVFQKFTRVQVGDERVKHGRGIGLFISRFFVEAHGGEIGLTSAPGQGSTFWFRVPLVAPASDSEHEKH